MPTTLQRFRPAGHVAKEAAYWGIPLLFCLAVYWYGLLAWYRQDDFAWLGLKYRVVDWPSFWTAIFRPAAHGTFRPLSERAYLLASSWFFGLDAFPARLLAFTTQFANLLLLMKIVWRLTNSRWAGFWAAIFWTANSSLYVAMTWSSAYMQVLCGFCLLLAFYLFLRHIETGRLRFYIWQWAVFLVGFGVMETNVVYPVLAAGYAWLCARVHFRKTLLLFVPSLVFLALHMKLAPKQAVGVYSMHLDGALPLTFGKYWQMVFFPESLHELSRLPEWVGWTSLAICSVAILSFVLVMGWRKHWLPVFFLLWFVVTLGPVLPLKQHVSDYYLTLPVIGVACAMGYGFAVAFSAGGRWGLLLKPLATTTAAIYLAISVPAARGGSRWWYEQSKDVEHLVLSVLQARSIHKDKTILLKDLSNDLFWGAIVDKAFRFADVRDVYVTPDSAPMIEGHPEYSDIDVAQYFVPPEVARRALENQEVVVYQTGGPRLRNVTGTYEAQTREWAKRRAPRRLDVGVKIAHYLLGPTWYPAELGYRWMPRHATARVAGPVRATEKLLIKGLCPVMAPDKGAQGLTVSVEGRKLATFKLEQGQNFQVEVSLPLETVGKQELEIALDVDWTIDTTQSGRELGLILGVLEIR